jgi:hypothetical protein
MQYCFLADVSFSWGYTWHKTESWNIFPVKGVQVGILISAHSWYVQHPYSVLKSGLISGFTNTKFVSIQPAIKEIASQKNH